MANKMMLRNIEAKQVSSSPSRMADAAKVDAVIGSFASSILFVDSNAIKIKFIEGKTFWDFNCP